MKTLSLDIETFASADLSRSGVYRYAESPDFEILLLGYSADGGPVEVIDLTSGEAPPPEIRAALTDDGVIKWAFNANFERVCLSRRLGLPKGQYLNPASWRCSMVWVAVMGLPLSLEGAGAALGLEKQKLKEGKELIRFFCQPCRTAEVSGNRIRNRPEHAPEKWAAFKEYNRRDVEAEMAVQERLSRFPVPETVWEEYRLDQAINDRGVALDMTLVRNAVAADVQSRAELTHLMKEITMLDNPNSVAQMKGWLADRGLETDTLGKKAVAGLLKTAPEPLRRVLELRGALAKSSVRKYQAMENAVCADGRARGMFQFYGANRSGRWSGRIIQLQNLPQNHLPDLEAARSLLRAGDFEALSMLYGSVPETLSELIRTAFIPKPGRKFIVADFSSIEARVIAWFAGETWKTDAFAAGEDIYCATASQMFHVSVVKHGENGHLRQKGKIAELACIAEGQLVLTDMGLIPIEKVKHTHRLWDGERWIRHGGVIFQGQRRVIEYEGLIATPDHLVWIEGESWPVRLEDAATSGAHLIQSGDGRRAIRVGANYQPGKTLESVNEPLLCSYPVSGLRKRSMAGSQPFEKRKIDRLPAVFAASPDSSVAGQTAYGGKTAVRKSKRRCISRLRRAWNSLRFSERDFSRALSDPQVRLSESETGDRPNRQQRKLRAGQSPFRQSVAELRKQAQYRFVGVPAGILAVCAERGHTEAISREESGRVHSGCGNGDIRETEKLENHLRTARLYDIRDAGDNHRFTVSGKLVHNCGYGGSVGALKAMGALETGVGEAELKPLVDAWRAANPHIVRLWWEADRAALTAVRERTVTETHGLRFSCQSGLLLITLPSGRRLSYVKPRVGVNRFGSDCVTYEGVGATKKWERLESYGPKLVENIVQATARDLLAAAMLRLDEAGYRIVMHIHDEVVVEAPENASVEDVCAIMSRTPAWAKGLPLRADGYECAFYKKD